MLVVTSLERNTACKPNGCTRSSLAPTLIWSYTYTTSLALTEELAERCHPVMKRDSSAGK